MMYRVIYKQGRSEGESKAVIWSNKLYSMRVEASNVYQAKANFYKVQWIDGSRFDRVHVLSIRREN